MELVILELERRGAATLRHGRASLLRHLTGTAAILERWRQPAHVRAAGLMHSVYATDAFAPALIGRDERWLVGGLIGAQAERLVDLFCSLDRRELFASLAVDPDDRGPRRLPSRASRTPIDVGADEIGDLLVLYLANEAEQAAAGDGSPGRWLASASQIAALIPGRARIVPPVFSNCTVRLSEDDERALFDGYARAFAGEKATRRAAIAVLCGEAVVGEPLVVAALDALGRADYAAAASLAVRADALLRGWDAAWDKRLTPARWRELAFLAIDAGTADFGEPRRAYVSAIVAGALRTARSPAELHARLDDCGLFGADVTLPARFAAYLSGLRKSHRGLSRYPGLDSRPWHDPARFPIVADLERHAETIAAECRALGDAFHGEQEPIAREGAWDVAFLWERGRRHTDVAQRCPVTTAVVERHRIVRGPAGLVYFSRLAPGTRIALHGGPTNLRLRAHLGIDVPRGCAISVGGETRTWTAGRCMVFDDSFPHEAWNDGDRDRLVLIVDVWHPDLTDDEIAMLEGLHRHVEGHAQNLRTYWERNDAAAAEPTQEPASRRP